MNWIRCSTQLPELVYDNPLRSAMVIVRHMSGGIGMAYLTMSWKATRIWVDSSYQRLTSEDECDLSIRITHWMPLPQHPKETDNE